MGQLKLSAQRPPIFIGAGVAKDEEGIARLAEAPAAACVIGSFTKTEWAGNSKGARRLEYWDGSAYYNSIGLRSPGMKEAGQYLPRSIRRMQRSKQTAIISVATLSRENPKSVLPDLVEWALGMGADGVEINGSCANQDPKHPLLCNDVDASYEVVDAVRRRVGSEPYLIYKVSALPPETIRKFRSEGLLGVDAIDTMNTLGNQQSPIDPTTGRPFIEVNGGLAGKSGPSILRLARAQLRLWLGLGSSFSLGKTFDMFSIGGVDSGREVYYRHNLGALLVGGTQAIRRAEDKSELVRRWIDEYADAENNKFKAES